MTTKPSDAPWADEPHSLIPTPMKHGDTTSHCAVWCASEMAHAHNCLIRGLNAILQQGPHVNPNSVKDVRDFLFFTQAWVKTVEHHHNTEETCMFPEMEKLAGKPGLLAGPIHQHEAFHDGLMSLKEYTVNTTPKEHTWPKMQAIIDSFQQPLIEHLKEEIEVILSLVILDSEGLKECWSKAETMAKAAGNLSMMYEIFPLVLGCCDKTFEGGNEFPPLPTWMVYGISGILGKVHSGAWRFNPCDFWGRPRPLSMIAKDLKR